MPDIVAFAPLFIFLIFGLLMGSTALSGFPHVASVEPTDHNSTIIHNLTGTLYSVTHSLIVFIAVFFLVWLIFRKPIYELFGWLLHILLENN